MEPKDKKKVKLAIEEKIIETIELLAELKEATKPMGLDSAVGRISRMDYINNKSVSEASMVTNEAKLKALNHWISIYDSDKFGRCSRCGNEINVNRLLFLPQSTRCIHCAEK